MQERGARRTLRSALALALGTMALLLSFAATAFAKTFTVTRTDDPTPSSCQKGNCSLREATIAADQHAGADTIEFAAGLSGETILLTQGSLEIRRRLTITGPGASKLAVSANDQSRVIHMPGGRVTIQGITITAGREAATANGATCPGDSANAYTAGGGILQDAGNLTLLGVTVKDNALRGPSGTILGGGGIANIDGTLALIRSRVTQGNVIGGSISGGGGILNCVGVVTLTRSTVKNSSVSAIAIGAGGGIANGLGAAQSTGEFTITESTLADNEVSSEAISEGGGGMTTGGPVNVVRSTISGNRATVTGGGSISDGGGFEDANSKVTFTNSTISDNKAIAPNAAGGGIVVGGTGQELSLRSSTLARNEAVGTTSSRGGNLLGAASASLLNTIVAEGVATSGSNCDGPVKSSGHDLEDADTCGFAARGDQVNKNPKLGQLADNGGPTETISLRRGSPAIDRAAKSSSPNRDQRGFKRGTKPDVGAFEFGAKP